MMRLARRTQLPLPLLIAAASIMLLCTLFLFYIRQKPSGHLRLHVVDAYSLLPLADACVVLPEAALSGRTGSDGMLDITNIPVRIDSPRSALWPSDLGETTVLCYRAEYRPYALFFAQIRPDAVRNLTLYLFPVEDDRSPTTVVEAPPETWVEELVEMHRP